MSCQRCLNDPQPSNYATPRKCAFDDSGEFTPDNWACASIQELIDLGEDYSIYGDDETCGIIPVLVELETELTTDGFIILSRYKMREKTSCGIWIGDFYPARPLTIDLIERVIKGYQKRNDIRLP